MNQSIMSTLVAGGLEKMRNTSPSRKGPGSPINNTGFDLGQMLNPVDSNSAEEAYSNRDI